MSTFSVAKQNNAITVSQNTAQDKPSFFRPRPMIGKNDLHNQEKNLVQKLPGNTSQPFIQQKTDLPQIQRHRALEPDESVKCLEKAEEVIKALETNEASGKYGTQDYIKEAIKLLRTKKTAGKIKCYAFEGIVHGVTDYSGDEIRLDGINLDWINETALLHEGVHAYHAVQNPTTAAQYAKALKDQRQIDPSKPADLKLMKWKAWTEYWAYRSSYEYYNPTRKQQMTEEEIHKALMSNRDVSVYVNMVRAQDPSFDPRTYKP